MLLPRQIIACAAALAAAACLAACGSEGTPRVVARVGAAPITTTTLDHWISVLAGGPGSSRPASSELRARRREQALQLLISSHWLIEEASARGLAASQQEVSARVDARRRSSVPG